MLTGLACRACLASRSSCAPSHTCLLPAAGAGRLAAPGWRLLQPAEGPLPVRRYMYPSDDSPGCTKQANAFKDNISAFKKAGAEGARSLCPGSALLAAGRRPRARSDRLEQPGRGLSRGLQVRPLVPPGRAEENETSAWPQHGCSRRSKLNLPFSLLADEGGKVGSVALLTRLLRTGRWQPATARHSSGRLAGLSQAGCR